MARFESNFQFIEMMISFSWLKSSLINQNSHFNHYFDRWHDAGTYEAKTKTGGPNGSIRNEEELRYSANNGLKIAVDLCGKLMLSYLNLDFLYIFLIAVVFSEEVKAKHPQITYADLYQVFTFKCMKCIIWL